MVAVTAEDVRHVEQIEQELAAEGREPERAALHKAVLLLRGAVVERLERAAGVTDLPAGRLPDAGEAPLTALPDRQERRLAELLAANQDRGLIGTERVELQRLLDEAEHGAMRNALALVRQHAPDSELYVRALRAYKRSFARPRRTLHRTTSAPQTPAG
jgi:hypothetical protein